MVVVMMMVVVVAMVMIVVMMMPMAFTGVLSCGQPAIQPAFNKLGWLVRQHPGQHLNPRRSHTGPRPLADPASQQQVNPLTPKPGSPAAAITDRRRRRAESDDRAAFAINFKQGDLFGAAKVRREVTLGSQGNRKFHLDEHKPEIGRGSGWKSIGGIAVVWAATRPHRYQSGTVVPTNEMSICSPWSFLQA